MRENRQLKTGGFDTETVEIRRVSRVVAGGKRFSFRAVVAAGDKQGRVGIGMGKGLDVAGAVEKGKRNALKNMIMVPLKEKRTIPHDVEAKYCASRVRLKPVRAGHGLIAGGSMRIILELAGVKDISGKIVGRTTNKLTNAIATLHALKKLKEVRQKRENENAPAEEIQTKS